MRATWEQSTKLVIVATALLAAAIRFTSVPALLPFVHHADEPTVERIVFQVARTPLASPRFFNYPSLVFYSEALVLRAYETLTGERVHPLKMLARGTTRTDSPGWWIAARSLTVLFGTGIAVLAALVAIRTTGRWWAGAVAGFWVALSPILANDSRTLTPDTYSAFFAMATLAMCPALANSPTLRDYLLGGVLVGLAAGSKYTVALAGVALVVTHLGRTGRKGIKAPEIWWAGLAAVLTFLVTTPFALFDASSFVAGFLYELHHYDAGHPGADGRSLAYYAGRLWESEGLRLFFVPLAFIGRTREQRTALAGILAFAFVHFFFIAKMQVHFERNLVPFVAPSLVLAAVGLCGTIDRLSSHRVRLVVPSVAAVAVLASIFPLRSIIDTIHRRPLNRRAAAERWLGEHIPPRSRIVLESYAPWIDPARFTVFGIDRLIDVPEHDLYQAHVKYAVVVEQMYGRYYEDRARYREEVALYDAIFMRYCELFRSTGPTEDPVRVLDLECINQ